MQAGWYTGKDTTAIRALQCPKPSFPSAKGSVCLSRSYILPLKEERLKKFLKKD